MNVAQVWLYALLGYSLGWGAWQASRRFVARYAAGGAPLSPWLAGGRSMTALSLVARLTLAALGAYTGWRAQGLGQAVSILVTTGLLLTIALVDLAVRRIPNTLCLALVAWSLAQMLWLGRPTPVSAALGLVVAGIPFLLIALVQRGAMGAGDVKLAVAGGALLGYPLILRGLFWGILAAGGATLLLMAMRRIGRKSYIAYGPYLALGISLALIGSLGLWW